MEPKVDQGKCAIMTAASTSGLPVSWQKFNIQSQGIFPEGCKAGLKNCSVTEQPAHAI